MSGPVLGCSDCGASGYVTPELPACEPTDTPFSQKRWACSYDGETWIECGKYQHSRANAVDYATDGIIDDIAGDERVVVYTAWMDGDEPQDIVKHTFEVEAV
jgi:hypothetical protein